MVGLHRLEGYLLASSIHPDGRKHLSFVALKLVFNPKLLFRSLYSSACFSTGLGSGLSLSHRLGIRMCRFLMTGLSRLRLTLWFSRLWRRSSIFVRILVSSSPGKSPISFHRSEWFIWVLLWIPLSSGLLPPSREREAMLNRRIISVLLHSACLFVEAGICLAQVNPHLDVWSDALDMG